MHPKVGGMDHGGGDGARRAAERPAVARVSDGREAGWLVQLCAGALFLVEKGGG